jgi:ERCC4-type nuclease
MLLDEFIEGKPVIVYDIREAKSFVVRALKKFEDITLIRRQLEIADYLVQTEKGTMAVERKRAGDLLNSIKDGRLFEQIENLLEYDDPRIIIEGAIFTSAKNGRCYSIDTLGKVLNIRARARSQPRTMWSTQYFVHPHALISIFEKIQDLGIKVIYTGSAYDTADILRHWATRGKRGEYLSIRQKRKTFTDLDRQLFLISGLMGISTKRAEALLREFGTPMRVFNAFLEYSPKKFPVEGIGEKTASEIRRVLTTNILDVKPKRMIEYEFREGIEELRKMLTHAEDDLKRKKVPVLKEILKKRGLKVGGTKGELIRRLLGDMSVEERVDVPLFIEKYEKLLETKTEFQNIPEDLQKVYEKFKRG